MGNKKFAIVYKHFISLDTKNSMIKKYHNHKLQTNLWHREEEPHNNNKTRGRQVEPQWAQLQTNIRYQPTN